MNTFLDPGQLIRWCRCAFQALFMLLACLLAGCAASDPEPQLEPPKLVVTAEVPFFELALSIDPEGEMELTPRLSPEKRFNLGPVGLKFGIEETVKLMGDRPYHLFILVEQEDGTIRRDEYRIGQKFDVIFTREQRVTHLKDNGESVLIAVARIRAPIIPDTGLQVQSVIGVRVEPAPEPEPEAAPAPTIVVPRATAEEALTENRPEREPEIETWPEEEPSRDVRAWARPERERWNRRPERTGWRTSEGVPLTISVFGDFNEIYVEEVEDLSAADMGDFEVDGEEGRYKFRLLKGKGAVITLCGSANRVYNPDFLDGRVRLSFNC